MGAVMVRCPETGRTSLRAIDNTGGFCSSPPVPCFSLWPRGRGFALIPVPIDQNPCAHWRSPMDMMRQGWSTSLFQALQQWSTRSS